MIAPFGYLADLATGTVIRPATEAEYIGWLTAMFTDRRSIVVGGVRVAVVEVAL